DEIGSPPDAGIARRREPGAFDLDPGVGRDGGLLAFRIGHQRDNGSSRGGHRVINHNKEMLDQGTCRLKSGVEIETPLKVGGGVADAGRLAASGLVALASPIVEGLQILEWSRSACRRESAIARRQVQVREKILQD